MRPLLLALVGPPKKPAADPGIEVDGEAIGAILVLLFFLVVVGGVIALLVWLMKRAARDGEISRARALAEQQAREAAEAAARVAAARAEFEELEGRFGAEVAGRIMRREIWVGAPDVAVFRKHGQPDRVDEIVKKAKVEHVLKYGHRGADRYALRYYIENGAVTGWEDKT